MKEIELSSEKSSVVISKEELLVFNNALNEVCNGVEIFEFESRIGVDREQAVMLLHAVGLLLDKMETK